MASLITTISTSTLLRRDDMPSATTGMPSLSSSSESYSTPSVSVPPNHDNPYILRTSAVSGTVFIAVGAIVGTILLAFILYHLIKSIRASSLAKKEMFDDKQMYEKYHNNNNTAYGLTPSIMNADYQQSVSKLPLLSHHRSKSVLSGFGGDNSTIYASEAGQQTTSHDMTRMFISPTAEAMYNVKGGGAKNASLSVANLSLVGSSTTNLSNPQPASNRHSQLIPNLYVNNEINNSEYSINHFASPASHPVSSPRFLTRSPIRKNGKPIPSMYLDDLMDDNSTIDRA